MRTTLKKFMSTVLIGLALRHLLQDFVHNLRRNFFITSALCFIVNRTKSIIISSFKMIETFQKHVNIIDNVTMAAI